MQISFRKLVRGVLGGSEEAIKAQDKAIAIDPDDAYAWFKKGYALADLGRFKKAIKAYDKAIAIDPDYVIAWDHKVFALYCLGRFEEGSKAIDKAIAIGSDSWDRDDRDALEKFRGRIKGD